MGKLITLRKRCMVCGEHAEVTVYEDDYVEWAEGKHAQAAFPYLEASEREKVISGTHPECWDDLFPAEST